MENQDNPKEVPNPTCTCPACGGTGTTKPDSIEIPGWGMTIKGLVNTCSFCNGATTVTLEQYYAYYQDRQ